MYYESWSHAILHAALLVGYAATWIYLYDSPLSRAGHKWYNFITMWNFMFQTVYTLACVASAASRRILGTSLLTPGVRLALVYRVVSPLTLFVFCAFWSIHLYREDLVLPPDHLPNGWFNHAIHSAILLLPLLEFSHLPPPGAGGRSAPCRPSECAAPLAGLSAGYLTYAEYTRFMYGVSFYPIFELLTDVQRFVFNGFMFLAVLPLCVLASHLLYSRLMAASRRRIKLT